MISKLACIVEGHSEVESVPILVRRVVSIIQQDRYLEIPSPIRVSRSKLVKPGEPERTIEFAARKISGAGGILLVLDSDDDCAATLAPQLLSRAKTARSDLPISVILAEKEFECWFLAAAMSLRGHRGLPLDLTPPSHPESIRGAKEWLKSRIAGGSYSPVIDQPSLTAKMDIDAAKNTNSFGKFFREIEKLLSS